MRKNLFINYLIVLLVVILLHGCTYSPSGENYNDIELPSSAQISINLSSANSDTIDVPTSTNFSYSVQATNNVNTIQIFLNENLIQEKNESSGNFFFDLNSINSGVHKLEIVAYVKTSSGSLADNLDLEEFFQVGTWYLSVDKDPPNQIEVENVVETDSGLVVSWDKYERANFLSYQLNFHRTEAPYSIFNTKTITDANETSIFFGDYIGQKLRFSVSVNTEFGTSQSLLFNPVLSSSEFLPIEKTEDGFRISWRKNQFTENFGSYALAGKRYGNDTFDSHFYSSNVITDTSYTFDYSIFVRNLEFQLQVRPKNSEFFTESIFNQTTYSNGEFTFDIPGNATIHSIGQNLLVFDYESVSLINTVNGSVLNSRNFSNGSRTKNFVLASTTINNDTGIIYKLDTNLLSHASSIALETLTDTRQRVLNLKAARNGSRAIFAADSIYLFDYETNDILATIPSPRDGVQLDISADGNLIYVDKKIYLFEDHSLELVRNSNTNVETFFSNTGSVYYEVDRSNNLYIKTYEYNNRVPIDEIQITGFRSRRVTYNIDQDVLIAYGYDSGVNTFDLSYGLLLISPSKDVTKSVQVYNSNASYYYVDTTLYSSDNIILNMSLE